MHSNEIRIEGDVQLAEALWWSRILEALWTSGSYQTLLNHIRARPGKLSTIIGKHYWWEIPVSHNNRQTLLVRDTCFSQRAMDALWPNWGSHYCFLPNQNSWLIHLQNVQHDRDSYLPLTPLRLLIEIFTSGAYAVLAVISTLQAWPTSERTASRSMVSSLHYNSSFAWLIQTSLSPFDKFSVRIILCLIYPENRVLSRSNRQCLDTLFPSISFSPHLIDHYSNGGPRDVERLNASHALPLINKSTVELSRWKDLCNHPIPVIDEPFSLAILCS
jgi:hypothetical protein